MIAIAIISATTAAALQAGAALQRRASEEELLFVGEQYRDALISYANATPAGALRLPPTLNDLLKDPRYPTTRRHLRKIFTDPLTGKTEWGLIRSPDGRGIIGVHSLADGKPVKQANFITAFHAFNGKSSYRDWIFSGPQQLQQ
ncbi:MAG TPA: type II secretion system protein [Burkholderiaceae bacterium]